MKTTMMVVGLWALVSIPAGILIGRFLRGAVPAQEPWGREDETQAALDAALEELERYANTGDPLYAESARSLFYLAGFNLANDLEIDGRVQR